MCEWLMKFDTKMGLEKLKIVVVLDNAGAYPRTLELKNVKMPNKISQSVNL